MSFYLTGDVGLDELAKSDRSIEHFSGGCSEEDDFVDGRTASYSEESEFRVDTDIERPSNAEGVPFETGVEQATNSVQHETFESDVRNVENQATSIDGVPIVKVDPILEAIEKRLVIGSTVRELDEGYALYCEYGRIKGFGVRRGIQKYAGKSKELKWKEFVCCCAGFPDCKKSELSVPRYKRSVTRSDCKAKIRFSRVLGSTWHVSRFVNEHNHDTIPADQTYLLRSYRNVSNANAAILEALHAAGIGISGACGFMEKESAGPENLGFLRRDAYNHFGRKNRKSKLKNADSKKLLDYFTCKANDEPFYFWKAETDEEGRLMNFFFRDMRCAEDYQAFGDVLSIDTTYRTNKYSLVCAPFVGINHHAVTVMFGMGFLSDETIDSFEWLFQQFLHSMKGAQPKVIFSDQCMAMMKAIDKTFPNAKHRLCQWHINRNAVKRFGSLNGNATFKRCWYRCLNDVENEEEFESVWNELLCYTKPSVKKRTWYTAMYDLRHRWASVFTRGVFTAGLLATSRSEGTNRCLKSVQACTDTLFQFVCNYENMKLSWRRREKEQDTPGNWLPGQLVSNNELFTQAASRYTRNVYKVFEVEATKSFDVIISHNHKDLGDGLLEITTQHPNQSRTWTVVLNKGTHYATCSCLKWESQGIFCRHIFKVYYHFNIFKMPESQILKRWTKKAKERVFVETIGGEVRSTLPYMLFLNTVMRHLYDMACTCVEDASGRPFIIKRLEEIRAEFFELFGTPPAEKKMKLLTDTSVAELQYADVRDPKPILDRANIAARRRRTDDRATSKGTTVTTAPKKTTSISVPRVPFQMREMGSVRTSLFHEHPAGWIPNDRTHRNYSSSQP